MELRHLRYFAAVAEEQSFSRAAARLRIAQPPLSRQIQDLEKELGLTLFRRSRQIELTAAGSTFLQHVRRIFDDVDVAVHEARRASRGESGRIAVGYPPSLAATGLPELLRVFRARFPTVEIALRELPPQDLMDLVRRHAIDVAFVRGPVDHDPILASEPVRSEPLVVALPPDHPLASRPKIALPLLAKESFIGFARARAPAFFDDIIALCHDAGFSPTITQEAPLLEIVSFVAAGFGVAIVPSSVRHVRSSGVVYRPIVGAPKTQLLLTWIKEEESAIVRGFVDVVRSVGVQRTRAARRRRV